MSELVRIEDLDDDELFDAGPAEHDLENPALIADAYEYLQESDAPGLTPPHVEDGPDRRTSWTAADLLAADLPAPRWAVEELLPEGLTFMCGAPKLGKSWLALALGIALAEAVMRSAR